MGVTPVTVSVQNDLVDSLGFALRPLPAHPVGVEFEVLAGFDCHNVHSSSGLKRRLLGAWPSPLGIFFDDSKTHPLVDGSAHLARLQVAQLAPCRPAV